MEDENNNGSTNEPQNDNENSGQGALDSLLSTIPGMFSNPLQLFITVVSVIFVVGFSLTILKHMVGADPVKDIYMNWDDIIYVSDYYDYEKEAQVVSVTIEQVEGFKKGITILHHELSQSEACPILINDSVKVPTMMGNTLVLPTHFDSVYGYVRQYWKERAMEE